MLRSREASPFSHNSLKCSCKKERTSFFIFRQTGHDDPAILVENGTGNRIVLECHGQLCQFPAALQVSASQRDGLLDRTLYGFVSAGDEYGRDFHGKGQVVRNDITYNYGDTKIFDLLYDRPGFFFMENRIDRNIVIQEFT